MINPRLPRVHWSRRYNHCWALTTTRSPVALKLTLYQSHHCLIRRQDPGLLEPLGPVEVVESRVSIGATVPIIGHLEIIIFDQSLNPYIQFHCRFQHFGYNLILKYTWSGVQEPICIHEC